MACIANQYFIGRNIYIWFWFLKWRKKFPSHWIVLPVISYQLTFASLVNVWNFLRLSSSSWRNLNNSLFQSRLSTIPTITVNRCMCCHPCDPKLVSRRRKDENLTRKTCTKQFQSLRVAKMKNLDRGFWSEKLCR